MTNVTIIVLKDHRQIEKKGINPRQGRRPDLCRLKRNQPRGELNALGPGVEAERDILKTKDTTNKKF